MTLVGYDTASSSFDTPTDAQFFVCYGDRLYENEAAAHARFPELVKAGRYVDLTAGGALWKDPRSGTDIEPGNAGPATAGPYVAGEHALGVPRPVVYADLSDMYGVVSSIQGRGIAVGPAGPERPWVMFTAHPTGREHLCGPNTCGFPYDADMTQFWWNSLSGAWRGFTRDLDVSCAREDAFGAPKPVNPFLIFPTETDPSLPNKGNERLTAEQADGALKNPTKYRNYLKGELRTEIKAFRDRIYVISVYQPPYQPPLVKRGKPDWVSNSRGTRWQLLNAYMQRIDAIK